MVYAFLRPSQAMWRQPRHQRKTAFSGPCIDLKLQIELQDDKEIPATILMGVLKHICEKNPAFRQQSVEVCLTIHYKCTLLQYYDRRFRVLFVTYAESPLSTFILFLLPYKFPKILRLVPSFCSINEEHALLNLFFVFQSGKVTAEETFKKM